MRLACRLLLACVASLVAPVAVAEEASRFALLIGNQSYAEKVGPLKNPHHDVALVGAALTSLGFKVSVVRDAGYRAMYIAINRHIGEVRRAGPGAIGFFYYSGHGVANPETQINYLIPVDVKDANDPQLWSQSFDQNDIIDKLNRQAPNATHYVVFDACRNELRLSGAGSKSLGAEKGFVPVAQTAGLLIAYATAPKETASDAGEGGGPYAKALVAEIVRPGVEAVTMFRNVQLQVKNSIGQDPWLSFPSLPEVYLAGRPDRSAAQPQPPLSVAAREWQDVKETTSVAVLESFRDRHKKEPVYVALAQERIAALQKDRAPGGSSPPSSTSSIFGHPVGHDGTWEISGSKAIGANCQAEAYKFRLTISGGAAKGQLNRGMLVLGQLTTTGTLILRHPNRKGFVVTYRGELGASNGKGTYANSNGSCRGTFTAARID